MSTLHTLKTYYSNVLRIEYDLIGASARTLLAGLAEAIDDGDLTLAQATAQIVDMADATTSVATMSYQFFTGAGLRQSGLDFLISPSGPNPTNLNSAYYQSFNVVNRYINFAVNLGKNGEAAGSFQAQYGALTASQAVTKAYQDIFGVTPTAEKVAELLNSLVPNGVGGQYTRLEYFAAFGGDGPNGVGTKAAIAGWLLSVAALEELGPYVAANEAFLTDLAGDGLAAFYSDMLSVYGPQPPSGAGATIAVAANQSVAPDQANTALRSTAGSDTVTGSAGLAAGQSVVTAEGHDVVTIAGAIGGLIDTGAGDDKVTVGSISAPVEILGGAVTGTVRLGAGDDEITVTGGVAGVLDGGAGWDKARVTGAIANMTGVEQLHWIGGGSMSGIAGVREVWTGSDDFPQGLGVTNAPSDIIWGLRGLTSGLGVEFAAPAGDVEVHLDGLTTYQSQGITYPFVRFQNMTGALRVRLDSDSTVGGLSTSSGYVTFEGVGRFTGRVQFTGPNPPAQIIDASAAGGIDLTYQPSARPATIILSGGDDRVEADLQVASAASFTLGAGADVFELRNFASGAPALAFSNLSIAGGRVVTYATVTDFQKGIDTVDLGARATAVFSAPPPGAGGPATLEEALVLRAQQLTADQLIVFEFGGDTWIFRQDGTGGVNTGDGLVRLVGVTGLALGGADGDIIWG